MSWVDAALGGGFALAGVALQQAFTTRLEKRRFDRDRIARAHEEQHAAFVDLVRVARRVQRALVDRSATPSSDRVREALAQEVDRLTEAVATIRLVVDDAGLVRRVEEFEAQAKLLEEEGSQEPLLLTPLIETLRGYEGSRP